MVPQRLFGITIITAICAFVSMLSVDGHADVTGSFTTHIAVSPQVLTEEGQTPSSEIAPLFFDLQNEMNVSVILSGFNTTLHTHFGLAGLEDAILKFGVTIGSMDWQSELVFGRFDNDDTIPDKSDPSFIKQRVTTTFTVGGATLKSLAIFEDTNFPQTPEFAFGDVITISGQTASGITVRSRTGFCANRSANAIKKHTWTFSVAPGCHGEPKPNLVFAFENLTIRGIPIAPSITGKAVVDCVEITDCGMTQTLVVAGGPVPVQATLEWKDLFALSFGSASITFSSGVGSLIIDFDSLGSLSGISVSISPTINPDSNPATLDIDASVTPGQGLTSGSAAIEISRGPYTLEFSAEFGNGPPAQFEEASLGVETSMFGFIDFESTATFSKLSLVTIESFFTINF